MPEDYFPESIASTYDDDEEAFDPALIDATVACLSDLAGHGAALEFAIGTGRIALPLAAKGVAVSGIELSEAMMQRLKQKPGAESIRLAQGDMANARVDGEYSLVYLVFNTIMNLVTQEAQVDCFVNAARHLIPGGHFVVEVMVPRLQRLAPGERFQAWDISDDHWGIDEIDVVTQSLVSHHLTSIDGKPERHSLPCRYVWPAELDLMARLAGMERANRWGSWQKTPFTAVSDSHVSVWRKLDD